MGRNKTIYQKLDAELPSWKYGKDAGVKVFIDEKDREEFIYAAVIVGTSNGALDLSDHDFKLLHSRREDQDNKIVARIVASKDGVIVAKIEPEAHGMNQWEAFLALRRDVEVRLERILNQIPSFDGMKQGASTDGVDSSTASGGMDQPPAYHSDGGGYRYSVDRKDRA